jgi:3-dehydroquinate synthase
VSVIKIKSNIRDYEVCFDMTGEFLESIKSIPNRFYIIDENVWRFYSGSLLAELKSENVIIQPISEERKNIESVLSLFDEVIKHAAKRNMTMVSIGGGILQDISGFVASTLYRGINWIFVPTTYLADSCIGSKTSLNYKSFKNLIGTFYPPSKVYIHTPFLRTLENTDFYSGLGEVVKLHIIGGSDKAKRIGDLLPRIEKRNMDALETSVKQSLLIKISYIVDDEFDVGRRNLLNFGHCFGHAVESMTNFYIPHGLAVTVGILLANRVASLRKLLSPKLEEHLAATLLFPILIRKPDKSDLNVGVLLEAMKKDKKRTGEGLALIMMKDGYEMVRVNDLTEGEVVRALEAIEG